MPYRYFIFCVIRKVIKIIENTESKIACKIIMEKVTP